VVIKAKFQKEAHETGVKDNPSCSSNPVKAKITAIRQRGSARKSPFQFVCMAHRDIGR